MAFVQVENGVTAVPSLHVIDGAYAGYTAIACANGLTRTRGGKTYYPFRVFYLGEIPAEVAADSRILTTTYATTAPYGIPTYTVIPM